MTVQLADKNVGGDHILAHSQTSVDGNYSFAPVLISPAYLKRHNKASPDLQVSVMSGTTILAISAVSYNAPLTVTLDIALPANASGLPSEYEALTAKLSTIYTGRLGLLKETTTQQDISFLANKTGWDARAIALAALADQFSQMTAQSPTTATSITATPLTTATVASTPAPTSSPGGSSPSPAQVPPVPLVSLKPEFYYALFRAGLPANADTLFQTGPGTVQAIWQQATAQGVIPQSLTQEIPAAVQNFQTLSAAHILNAPPPAGISTLQEMLAPTLTNTTDQQKFTLLFSQYRDNWSNFWPAVEKELGDSLTKQLQFMGQLYNLSLNNQPLVAALTKAEAQASLATMLDLATRGYYDPAKWLPLIGASIPPGIPGTGTQEQSTNYAQFLAAQVRISYPTAVLAHQIDNGIVPIADTPAVATAISKFLTAQQGQFEIGVEPVEAFLANNPNIARPATEVINHINRFQRVYQITQDDNSLSVLLSHNLDSAYAVTRYDSAGFVRAFGDKLGGAATARAIHNRSEQVFSYVLNMATSYITGRNSPTFGGASTFATGFPPQSGAPSYPVIAYPTLEDLFGSQDYCNCSDCGSILSPAAYLVDLLHYLDQPSPTVNYQNPQDVLFQRRPDLQYLALTCENTNTALPYIDVVNETLEYYVASGSCGNPTNFQSYQGYNTSDTVSSAELLACPQYVNDAAYTILENAFFPPPLPFNRPLEVLRLHLQNLGIALPDAMIALRANDQLNNATMPSAYGWSDILIEQLTLSRDEYRLFTDSSLDLGKLYGLTGTTALTTLQGKNLQDFSRRVGVSYADLSSILQTRFINPNAALIPKLQRLNVPFSTLQALQANPQAQAAGFIQNLPTGLDLSQYGGDVVSWVVNLFTTYTDLITFSNPSSNIDDCSGADWWLLYLNGNPLSGTDYLKLIRFIRLWQKLAPLLGNSDNSVAIAQTDAIMTALYPAAELPVNSYSYDPIQESANRAKLDAGFQTLLLRSGFLLQIMNRLSLTADAALDQLLSCWGDIGTTGVNSLYQRMFLTPSLLQQDLGAQTATVNGPFNQGDILYTFINNSSAAADPSRTNEAAASHTVAIDVFGIMESNATVATAMANAINSSNVIDPVSNQPFGKRFYATNSGNNVTTLGNVITIKTGFIISPASPLPSGAISYTTGSASDTPLSQTMTLSGSGAVGDALKTTINGVDVLYTVAAGDDTSLPAVARKIAAAINNNTEPDHYSGLPLNSLVYASANNAIISIAAINADVAFTLTCALKPVNSAILSVSLASSAYVAGRQLPPFADNGYGSFLADPSQLLFDHESLLCAAGNLTGAEFSLIAQAQTPPFSPTTPLTLDNVSTVFRYGWLAHTLGLSVVEFLGLKKFTGLDPFATLDPGTTPTPVEPPAILFIRLLQAINDAGLKPEQALYLMANQDISGNSAPPLANITGLAFSLRADFAAVEAQFSVQDDPKGSIALSLMTLVYGSTASAFFFSLLNNTLTTSIPFSNALPILPQSLIDASVGRFGYNDLSKQLSFAGVLDSATTLTAIKNALIVNTTDGTDNVAAGPNATFTPASMTNIGPGTILVLDSGAAQESVVVTGVVVPTGTSTATGFTAATTKAHNGTVTAFSIVNDPSYAASLTDNVIGGLTLLAAANAKLVNPFFQTYPELQPLFTAYADSKDDDLQTRRNTLLDNFLPTLKQKRKQEQGLSDITAAVGSDPSYANSLLQDPSILHADTDASLSAVTDLTGIENTGLTLQLFIDNNPNTATSSPDGSVDCVPLSASIQTLSIAGNINVNDVLVTLINGIHIPYTTVATDTTPAILAKNIAALINATTLPDPNSGLPINQLVAAASNGVVIAIIGIANQAFTLTPQVTTGSETYAGGGGPIAGVWSGYMTAPQDGYYNFAVATDVGADITLNIADSIIFGSWSTGGALWNNQSPVYLQAGALVPINISVTSIKTTFSVSWQSQGLGWQTIPSLYLYAQNLVNRLGNTYVRFLKTTSLATALSLTANEIAYLGTASTYSVNTNCASKVAVGSNVLFTPQSMNNIAIGSTLVIDSGNAQETVSVIAIAKNPSGNAIGFKANTTLPHDGSATPFPIVDKAQAVIGSGWLNSLAAVPDPTVPDSVTAQQLYQVLVALLDYARIKQALSPGDERLLAVLQNPLLLLPNQQFALTSLTGWSLPSLNALLTQFFGTGKTLGIDSQSGVLSSQANLLSNNIENFRRVYDAYALVQTCRVNASALIASVTNTPSSASLKILQSALRGQYALSDWLTVVRPINDSMRSKQRDALVAYILQQLGDQYQQSLVQSVLSVNAPTGATQLTLSDTSSVKLGMSVQGMNIAHGTVINAVFGNTITINPGILAALQSAQGLTLVPANAFQIDTADKLFEYFLIDVETQPAVETSRIRLALSAVQLFIERIVRNLEPQVSPADVDINQWQWMKRYRVWQANREVFLWPENWAYPELRDNQSPLFQNMMSALLQSDITDDAAINAYLDYLTSLEEIAKLEPCGHYYQSGGTNTDEASYVVARTAGTHRKHYFRQLQGGSWTPWTQVSIDCEDMPLTPIIWNGRLFLFWLKILKQVQPPSQPIDLSQSSNHHLSSQPVSKLKLSDMHDYATAASSQITNKNTVIQAVLCWSEFYNGKWQTIKTSHTNRPATIGSFDLTESGSFEAIRDLVRIDPVEIQQSAKWVTLDGYTRHTRLPTMPTDVLILAISNPSDASSNSTGGSAGYNVYGYTTGFVLYNTHSLPVRFEDIIPTSEVYTATGGVWSPVSGSGALRNAAIVSQCISSAVNRTLAPVQANDGSNLDGTFSIEYPLATQSRKFNLLGFSWTPRYVEPQIGSDWNSHFIFEDRRHLFYVQTSQVYLPLDSFTGYGFSFNSLNQPASAAELPPVVIGSLSSSPPENSISIPASSSQTDQNWKLINASYTISYQGVEIAATGSLATSTLASNLK